MGPLSRDSTFGIIGWAFIGLLTLTLFWTIGVSAQEPIPSDDEVNAIAKNLYCPVCENVPLDVCPTQACIQWREQIRERLAEGWTQDQIYDYFVLQYGDRVLAEPPPAGFNWIVYVVPPLAIVGGMFILFRVMRSWRVPATVDGPAPASEDLPPADEYQTRLEEELQRRQDYL